MIELPAAGGALAADAGGVLRTAAFVVLLAAASVGDLRSRRIPNRLVAVTALAGLGFSAALGGDGALVRSLGSLALGFAIWIPLYALRMVGAGDVKLFAAASAWLAPLQVVDAALVAALVGGGLSLVYLARELGGRTVALRLILAARHGSVVGGAAELSGAARGASRRRVVPYGVAMAAGLLLAFSGLGVLRH
jgi:prepilin peptidase CpaA